MNVSKLSNVSMGFIDLVDVRAEDNLQGLCFENARKALLHLKTERIRERWQRTTVYIYATLRNWQNVENQPYLKNDVVTHRGYLKDIHLFVDPNKNKYARKPKDTYTDMVNTDVACGAQIGRVLRARRFDLCMIHHLDFGKHLYIEAYGDGGYSIYYHEVATRQLYWRYSTVL